MRKVTKTVPRPERKRVNQPMGYKGKKAVHKYKCKGHDYVYYGEDWYDHSKGMSYRKGYYDELGNRYDSLIIHNPDGSLESLNANIAEHRQRQNGLKAQFHSVRTAAPTSLRS